MKNLDIYKKIRKEWIINPKSRIKMTDKGYDRNQSKKDLEEVLRELEDDGSF